MSIVRFWQYRTTICGRRLSCFFYISLLTLSLSHVNWLPYLKSLHSATISVSTSYLSICKNVVKITQKLPKRVSINFKVFEQKWSFANKMFLENIHKMYRKRKSWSRWKWVGFSFINILLKHLHILWRSIFGWVGMNINILNVHIHFD